MRFLQIAAVGIALSALAWIGPTRAQDAAQPPSPIPVPMGTWNSNETTALKYLLGEMIKLKGREVSKTADYLIDRVEAQEKLAIEAMKKPAADPAPAQ